MNEFFIWIIDALCCFELDQPWNEAAVPPGNDMLTSSLAPWYEPSRFSATLVSCDE